MSTHPERERIRAQYAGALRVMAADPRATAQDVADELGVALHLGQYYRREALDLLAAVRRAARPFPAPQVQPKPPKPVVLRIVAPSVAREPSPLPEPATDYAIPVFRKLK